MKMPGFKSCINKPPFLALILILHFFCGVIGQEKEIASPISRKHVKKKHSLNHRLDRGYEDTSQPQTYRYDHDVNIGKLVLENISLKQNTQIK